jgi:hypothetical protein
MDQLGAPIKILTAIANEQILFGAAASREFWNVYLIDFMSLLTVSHAAE